MNIKKPLRMLMLCTMILTFWGCQSDNFYTSTNNPDKTKEYVNDNSLNTPDIINMYADGEHKQLSKLGDIISMYSGRRNPFPTDYIHEQILFDRINILVNIRIPQELSTIMSPISENDIKEAKGYAVEFVYNEPQTVTINNGNKVKVELREIIFPLGGRWQNSALIKNKYNIYMPVGLKENLDSLVKASMSH